MVTHERPSRNALRVSDQPHTISHTYTCTHAHDPSGHLSNHFVVNFLGPPTATSGGQQSALPCRRTAERAGVIRGGGGGGGRGGRGGLYIPVHTYSISMCRRLVTHIAQCISMCSDLRVATLLTPIVLTRALTQTRMQREDDVNHNAMCALYPQVSTLRDTIPMSAYLRASKLDRPPPPSRCFQPIY